MKEDAINKDNLITMNINYYDRLLEAVNQSASILLQSEPEQFDSALNKSMCIMAQVVSADRTYIWRNHLIEGELCCSQIYEWSENVESQQDNEYTINIPYNEAMPEMLEFVKGKSMNGPVTTFSEASYEHLSGQGIKSVLIVPIFLKGEFWGFMGFDDCHNERIFTENEEAILRSASLQVGSALLRNEMVQNLKEKSLQLESAIDAACNASRAKSEFLSRMSHEIRTPMNAVIGMTDIAKRATTTEGKDKALEKIRDASTHLLSIINDILDMAKIEEGKLELSPIDFSFRKTLQRTIDMIEFRTKERKQKLNVNIDENIPPSLIGDELRIAQVITNLLSNAVKFTPEEGEITLDAKLVSETNDLYDLLITISDTGIGIDEKKKEKLFTPFTQAEAETARRYGGTGLGLSISKSIIEKMGGKIEIESAIGKGTTFYVTLSLERGNEMKLSQDAVEQDIYNSDQNNFSGHTILIAEDVEINREIVAAVLEGTNLEIEFAENGIEAVDKFKANPDKYDMIFMDIQMPEMDGLEATRKIRKLAIPKAKTIQIVAMTASAFREDKEKCIDAGMNGHVSKPINVNEVIEVLRKCLRKRDEAVQDIMNKSRKTYQATTKEPYVIFKIEDARYAVSIGLVEHIREFETDKINLISNQPEHMLGQIQYGEKMIPITEASTILGHHTQTRENLRRHLIVLSSDKGTMGMVVDEAISVGQLTEEFSVQDISPLISKTYQRNIEEVKEIKNTNYKINHEEDLR